MAILNRRETHSHGFRRWMRGAGQPYSEFKLHTSANQAVTIIATNIAQYYNNRNPEKYYNMKRDGINIVIMVY